MTPMRPTRRALLAAAAGAVPAPRPVRAAAPRLAAIDWALLETALALGADVVAAAELILYRKLVVEPPIPDTVAPSDSAHPASPQPSLDARPPSRTNSLQELPAAPRLLLAPPGDAPPAVLGPVHYPPAAHLLPAPALPACAALRPPALLPPLLQWQQTVPEIFQDSP